MLKVESLSASYGGIQALRNVSLQVEAGRMVTLIGANGAGKSTLVNTISGIVRATHGVITFENRNVVALSTFSRVRAGIIQVPEGRQVLGPMSVEENLQLGTTARGSRHDAKSTEMEDVFELFPILRERRAQAAGSMSGGEQQMLAIGRALMGNPKLLLLDEPSLGLSPLMVKAVFAALAKLNAAGLTIFLIEQNARMALQTAQYAYVIDRGVVTLEGAASDLLSDPRVAERYLGG